MKIFSILFCFIIFFTGCSPAFSDDHKKNGAPLRVLFLGNSYTYVNDLPKMFAQLANAGDHQVETGMIAKGGWTLAHHVNSPETINAIRTSKWDYVIIQEQSQIPAIEKSRKYTMYPSAQYLLSIIKQSGATPIIFMTWGHRNGWPEQGIPDFESMQSQLEQGYLEIARELTVAVAPVGRAWSQARRQYPEIDLWQGDGSHPSELGTYLASCVIYTVIFRQSPEGLKCPVNMSKENTRRVQRIAASVVLQYPKQWNLP